MNFPSRAWGAEAAGANSFDPELASQRGRGPPVGPPSKGVPAAPAAAGRDKVGRNMRMTLLAFRRRPREADHIGSSNRPGGGRWPRDTPLHAGGAGRLERAVPNMALIQIYASRPGQGRAAPPRERRRGRLEWPAMADREEEAKRDQRRVTIDSNRHRQSKLTFGAAVPFGVHVNTVICKSLKMPGAFGFGTNTCVMVA